MQKKNIVMAISAIGAILSTSVNAQGALSPTERVVIGQDSPRLTVPTQAANPLGSIQQGGGGINYGGGGSLSQQQPIQVPTTLIDNSYGVQGSVYGAQLGVPNTLPAGLPNSVQAPLIRQDRENLSPIEKTMNILNTPDERIQELNQELYRKGKLFSQQPVPLAKSVNSIVVASLAPGAISPVVRLSRGRTTAIVFTDSTGKPWPIMNIDGLPDTDFIVNRLDGAAGEGYMLSVTPLGQNVSGNMVVVLKDLPSPLLVEFVTGQAEVDAKTEIRVQAIGPNAVFQTLKMPETINSDLLSLLQGVAPSGAKSLETNTNAVQAWLSNGQMLIRTRYRITSPAFIDISSSPDGTFAYVMEPAPIVLYSAGMGKTGAFSVSGY